MESESPLQYSFAMKGTYRFHSFSLALLTKGTCHSLQRLLLAGARAINQSLLEPR